MDAEDKVKVSVTLSKQNLTRLNNLSRYTNRNINVCLDELIEDHLSYVNTQVMEQEKLERFKDEFLRYSCYEVADLIPAGRSEHDWRMNRVIRNLFQYAGENDLLMDELYQVYKSN